MAYNRCSKNVCCCFISLCMCEKTQQCLLYWLVNIFGLYCKWFFFFLLCCCCSVAKLCSTRCDPVDCMAPDFPVLHYLPELLKLMSTESMMPFYHIVNSLFGRNSEFVRKFRYNLHTIKFDLLNCTLL